MRIILVALALLPACAAQKIQDAHDMGYTAGRLACEQEQGTVISALEGGKESLKLSLNDCYKRLDQCEK